MKQRVYRGTRLQKCNIRLVAFMWATLGATALASIVQPLPHSFFQQAFNHSSIAIGIFVVIALGRGLIGLVQPKRYWLWFRAGSFNVAHNSVRGWSWVLATGAWIACASLTPFSLPDWLIVWGVATFVWLVVPYSVYATPDMYEKPSNMFNDSHKTLEPINPATGLPIAGGKDICGHPFGRSD